MSNREGECLLWMVSGDRNKQRQNGAGAAQDSRCDAAFDKEVRSMSEITFNKVNLGTSERKSFGERFGAFMKYTMHWYGDLAERTGYRFPFTV